MIKHTVKAVIAIAFGIALGFATFVLPSMAVEEAAFQDRIEIAQNYEHTPVNMNIVD